MGMFSAVFLGLSASQTARSTSHFMGAPAGGEQTEERVRERAWVIRKKEGKRGLTVARVELLPFSRKLVSGPICLILQREEQVISPHARTKRRDRGAVYR